MSQKLEQEEKRLSISSPADWIEENIYIPETKDDPVLQGRFQLQPYQRDCLNEALSKDENGLFKYSLIVWSDIKKSAKSTVAAAIALYMAQQPWAETYLIANDLKQADSRVAYYARRAIQLSPHLKDKYRTRGYSILGNNGSRIEALPIDPEGEAGSNADMIQFCLDEETEVLTHRGWKFYDEVLMTDAFATQNQKTGKFEWQLATSFFLNRYQGKMWHYETPTMSMLISSGHKIYGKYEKTNNSYKHFLSLPWELKPIEETLKYEHCWLRTRSDGWDGIGDVPETISIGQTAFQEKKTFRIEDWVEFMGWYLSEGCVAKHGTSPRTVLISQSKEKNPENHKEIIDLLRRMNLNPKVYEERSIAIHNKSLGEKLVKYGLSGDKYIPLYIKNLPQNLLLGFLRAYIKGDGCCDGSRVVISTKSERMKNDLAEVGQKCGYHITSRFRVDERYDHKPPLYMVYLVPRGKRLSKKLRPKLWKKVDYDGHIWCPSTKNGVIYVRRNGKYYWTGNSELWGAQDDAKSRMWTELTLSPTKFGKSFRLVESYAGYMEESLILYNLWELGVQQGSLLWPDRLYDVTEGEPTMLEAYANPEARMFCMWNTQPRCPWQTSLYYQSEKAILHPLEFERMHRNQWITQTTTFVPMEWWDACEHTDDWPEIPENHPMIMAADAGTMKDNFGIIICCNHPEKDKYPDAVLVWYARKWVPPKGVRGLDFVGTDENPGPEMEIRRFVGEKNIIELAYDEYQLHDMMNRLRKDGNVWCRRFPQGSGKHSRAVADAALYDKIRDRKIWHRGEPELREHIQNANAKIDDQERRLRIVKRVEHLKVDLAVGLSMASYEVERLNL